MHAYKILHTASPTKKYFNFFDFFHQIERNEINDLLGDNYKFVKSGEYRKLSDLFDHFMMFSTILAISLYNSRYD